MVKFVRVKNIKGVVIIVVVLFIIPFGGYLVLRQGAADRMDISSSLQPKGQLSKDLTIVTLENNLLDTIPLMPMPYILKVLVAEDSPVDLDNLSKIITIINDRTDLAMYVLGDRPVLYSGNRIYQVQCITTPQDILKPNEMLLIDRKNQILKKYDLVKTDNVYGALLEDISYALPMIDFQMEKELEASTDE